MLFQLPAEPRQAFGVLESGARIVDRTGPDHHHHSRVALLKDIHHLLAGAGDELGPFP